MLLFKVRFDPKGKQDKTDLEESARWYISSLFHNGQACGEYFCFWNRGVLNAYVCLTGVNAHALRYHSKYGKKHLREIVETFGRAPEWIPLDGDTPKRNPSWSTAPLLYLYTTGLDWDPPVCRGDNGQPIPTYLLPVSHDIRDGLRSWASSYGDHDCVWLHSGTLEIPAYKELVEPGSELSLCGRDLCRSIEEGTGIPTYYYLMRYWGRRKDESQRKCPGCGRKWRVSELSNEEKPFWEFDFRCDKCRLVSRDACDFEDERHARIGEYCSPRVKKSFK